MNIKASGGWTTWTDPTLKAPASCMGYGIDGLPGHFQHLRYWGSFRHTIKTWISSSPLWSHLGSRHFLNISTFFFSLAYDSSHSEILLLHSSHMFCFRLRELLFCWQDILLEAHILLLRQNSKWQDYTLECTASPGQNWPSQFPLHVVNTQKTVNELNWGLYNVFSLIKLWFVLAFVIRIRQKKGVFEPYSVSLLSYSLANDKRIG